MRNLRGLLPQLVSTRSLSPKSLARHRAFAKVLSVMSFPGLPKFLFPRWILVAPEAQKLGGIAAAAFIFSFACEGSKPELTAELRILRQELGAENATSGASFQVRDAQIIIGEEATRFFELDSPPPANVTNLQIRLEGDAGSSEALPNIEAVERTFLALLQSDFWSNPTFDCDSLARFFVEGVTSGNDETFLTSITPTIASESDEFLACELIVIGSASPESPQALDYQQSYHFAIHLGEGIYLSKFGTEGPIIFATLPEMMKGFRAAHVWRVEHPALTQELVR